MSRSLLLPDASALIALEKAQHLYLLPELYDEVVTTDVVVAECVTVGGYEWLGVTEDYDRTTYAKLLLTLDPGESSVLALADRFPRCRLLVDDASARREARHRGLDVIGVLGIAARAEQEGLIDDASVLIRTLMDNGLWASDAVVAQALKMAKLRPGA